MHASPAAEDQATSTTLAAVSVSGGKDSTAAALLALEAVTVRRHAPGSVSRHAWLAVLMTGYALLLVDAAWAAEVWVITDQKHPINSVPGIRLIELDATSHIEAELARDLPADATKAAAIATQRLKSDHARLQQLAAAYQAVVDAWSLGIVKIPAVVVDRKFVVYGEPDVERALRQIARYRSEQR